MLACLERIDCIDGACEARFEPDGSACVGARGRGGSCRRGVCVPERCGDGRVDPGEDCDDGGDVGGDGCEPDCVNSCDGDEACQDDDLCDGMEHCADAGGPSSGRICVEGSPPTLDSCEVCLPERGPYRPDADGDGFAQDVGQPCEPSLLDCDDADPAVFPGADEVCNGLDDDCDGPIDEGVVSVICAVDADGDGYAGSADGLMTSCAASCPPGTTPPRTGASGMPLLDCWDVADAFGPLVHPGQTEFFVEPYCSVGDARCSLPYDYDCDGLEQRFDVRVGPRCDLLSLAGCRGDGWVPPVPGCGREGEYANCERVLLLACGARREVRRQSCR